LLGLDSFVFFEEFVEQHRVDRNVKDAVELDPRNIHTLQQIADTYRFLRHYAEAKLAYDRALAIAPDEVETRVGRALTELHWKADTAPLHQLIDSVRATNPAAIRDIADTWFICALAERDAAAAKHAAIASGQSVSANNEALISINRLWRESSLA
jgi:cytochrome c-type biogenesis protein CcmH/NrfG